MALRDNKGSDPSIFEVDYRNVDIKSSSTSPNRDYQQLTKIVIVLRARRAGFSRADLFFISRAWYRSVVSACTFSRKQ
jgi:hypothetical protein